MREPFRLHKSHLVGICICVGLAFLALIFLRRTPDVPVLPTVSQVETTPKRIEQPDLVRQVAPRPGPRELASSFQGDTSDPTSTSRVTFEDRDRNYASFVEQFVGTDEKEVLALLRTPEDVDAFRAIVGKAFSAVATSRAEIQAIGAQEARKRVKAKLYNPYDTIESAKPWNGEYIIADVSSEDGGAPVTRIVRIFPGEVPEIDKLRDKQADLLATTKETLVTLVTALRHPK